MQILQINSLQSFNNFQFAAKNNIADTKYGLKMAEPLSKDTISFKAKTTIADTIATSAKNKLGRYNRLATTYLDILGGVANDLSSLGVSFSRAYCKDNAVKDPEKYLSKINRSGNLKIPDKIRATLFVSDICDMSILNNHILPALADRGFVLSTTEADLTEMISKGYTPKVKELSDYFVKVPDLDIRLANVKNASVLDEKYRFSISKPQKSGYQDIQMRLIREHDPDKKNPISHELIILSGKNYAFAKHLESEHIYGLTRQYSELNIIKKGSEKVESCRAAKNCVESIKNILTTEVSQKLYANAMILDSGASEELLSIKLPEDKKRFVQKCFNELEKNIESYYETAANSPKFCEATKKRFAENAVVDKQKVAELRKKLEKTIKFFNEKDYLERRTDIWPTLFGEEFKAN